MTTETDLGRIQYNGNGVTTAFVFNSKVLAASHLAVIVTDSLGVETTLILNTDYAVSGVGGTSATVTTTLPVASGSVITIVRNVPFTQETDYVPNDPFPAQSHENALDKLTQIAQQLRDQIGRALKFPATDATSLIADLPSAAARALKVLSFDALGNPTVTNTDAQSAIVAQAAAAEATAQAALAQSAAAGFKSKNSVRAATTANITLSAPQTIDGVAVTAGQRVLVKNQSTTSQNGIYQVNAGAWTRTTDADSWDELVSASVYVDEGSTQADSLWFCPINLGGTLGSTAITWVPNPIAIPDGAISTAAKVVDGILTYAKLATAAIASLADIVAGTSSKLVTASVLKSMRYDSGLIAMPAATTYDFTGIPTGAKRITLTYMNLSSNATFLPWLRLGSGGVPVTSGYTGCVSQYANTIASTTLSSAFWFMQSGNAATTVYSGIIQMELVDEVTNTWVVNSVGAMVAGATAGNNMCGMVSLPGPINMLRFGVDAGNMDSGSARVIAEVW